MRFGVSLWLHRSGLRLGGVTEADSALVVKYTKAECALVGVRLDGYTEAECALVVYKSGPALVAGRHGGSAPWWCTRAGPLW